MPWRVNVSRTMSGPLLSWPTTALNPPASKSAVMRIFLMALILSIPPLAAMFLAISSSGVCADRPTARQKTLATILRIAITGNSFKFWKIKAGSFYYCLVLDCEKGRIVSSQKAVSDFFLSVLFRILNPNIRAAALAVELYAYRSPGERTLSIELRSQFLLIFLLPREFALFRPVVPGFIFRRIGNAGRLEPFIQEDEK